MITKASFKTTLLITLFFLSLFQGTAFSAKRETCIAGKGKVCNFLIPSTTPGGSPSPASPLTFSPNPPSSLTLGAPFTLTPPSGGIGNGPATYESKTPSVCTVVSDGVVTTLLPGACIIDVKKGPQGYVQSKITLTFQVTAPGSAVAGGGNVAGGGDAAVGGGNAAPPNAGTPASVNQTTPVVISSTASSFYSGGTVTLTISGGNGTGAYDLTGTGTCTVTSAGGSNQATLTGTNTTASATNCSIKARKLESPGFLTSSYSAPVNITINPPACSSDIASINTPVVDNNSRHVTISGTTPNCIGTIHFYQQASSDPTETWNYNPVQFSVSNGSFNQIITRSDGGPLAAKTWNMNLCFRTAPIPSGYQVGQCRTVTFTVTAPQLAGCSGNITPPIPEIAWFENTYDDGAGNISNVYSPQLINTFRPPEGVSWVHVEAQDASGAWNRLLQATTSVNSDNDFNGSSVNLMEIGSPPTASYLRLVYEAPYPNCDVGIATTGEMAAIPSLP